MGVFHWSQLVGNWVFFEGLKQCLQSRLRSVVVSQLVMVDWQNIKCLIFHQPSISLYLNLGNCPVIDLYSMLVTVPVLSNAVTVLSWLSTRTPPPDRP